MFTTIISPPNLLANLHQPNWRIIDCSFDLSDTELGRNNYKAAHIPGAIYAHLDDDLSGPIMPTKTSRHPLPSVEDMCTIFGEWGIDENTQVIVYDQKRGALAARLWWMLRYLGHRAVAVLDGGSVAWQQASGPMTKDVSIVQPTSFESDVQGDWLVTVADIEAGHVGQLIDSRTPERYRGEHEPIDPIAGHIPGAINLPFPANWNTDGDLLPKAELAARFATVADPNEATFYCGSGVTACHNLLAYAHAGLGNARLYAGSWSEWITDPQRTVAVAEEG